MWANREEKEIRDGEEFRLFFTISDCEWCLVLVDLLGWIYHQRLVLHIWEIFCVNKSLCHSFAFFLDSKIACSRESLQEDINFVTTIMVTKKITSTLSHFWWSGSGNKKRNHWLSWDKVCTPKEEEEGGGGIEF